MMDGTTPITDVSEYDNADYTSTTDPDGILYITANSGSGSKYYKIKQDQFSYAAVKNQEKVPTYSKISVTDHSFEVTTYRAADNSVVDNFTINRTDNAQMYRMYNPNSGEHFYTADEAEKNTLIDAGWTYEGIGWTAPAKSDTPVYRLYNPNAGDHHYTTSVSERNSLIEKGWNDEGIGWYSDDSQTTALYRLYNPNAQSGAHHYTTSIEERDHLISLGWHDELIGWYGV
jgi:hypothetical protein